MRHLTKTIVAIAAAATTAPPANAALMLMVGNTAIVDNGTGDSDSRTGVISYTGAVGSFNMNLSTQTGSFSASPMFFDLANTLVSSGGAGSLTIELTSTGLTTPSAASQFLTQFSGNFTSAGATVTAMTYFDASNAVFGMGTPLANLSASSSPYSLSSTNGSTGGTPFSLTEVIKVTTTGSTSFSLDTSISVVPEPTSLALISAGMVGVGVLRNRLKRPV